MANKKRSSTHTGQAGVVAITPPKRIITETESSLRKDLKAKVEKIKKEKWNYLEKEFQEWLDDPIDGSKCSYTSQQRLEIVRFFKQRFLK